MFEDRKADLSQAITLFESLLDSYLQTRERLIARRRDAPDHVRVDLDDRLAANARTIDSFHRGVECLRVQLASLDNHEGCAGLLLGAAPGGSPEASREANPA